MDLQRCCLYFGLTQLVLGLELTGLHGILDLVEFGLFKSVISFKSALFDCSWLEILRSAQKAV